MKTMIKKIACLFIVLLFSSCASLYTGALSSGPLLSANDKYVDVASGYATATYIFGIGGLSKTALVYEAKTDLMNSRPLKKGEYYSNFTVDFRKTVAFFIYITNEVYVHADILTANPDSEAPAANTNGFKGMENEAPAINYVKTKEDSFYVGEKIVHYYTAEENYKFRPYEIISFTDKGKVNLKNLSKGERNISVNINELIFSVDKTRNGFTYGDSVSYKSKKLFNKKPTHGKVVATSKDQLMVLEGKNTYEMKYDEVTKLNKAK
jgi:hypothetical protein